MQKITPTGRERRFSPNELIVTKTDNSGKITYCNDIYLRISGYTERETLGKPHNIIRHPEMPRMVFKWLWDHLKQECEIFAYVCNMAKNGDHYWVLAHVTPSYDLNGRNIGYHSSRRVPEESYLKEVIQPLYKQLLSIEAQHSNPREAMAASEGWMQSFLQEKGVDYHSFLANQMR